MHICEIISPFETAFIHTYIDRIQCTIIYDASNFTATNEEAFHEANILQLQTQRNSYGPPSFCNSHALNI